MKKFVRALAFCLVSTAFLPVPSFAADATAASVDSHLAALSWLVGTFACTSHNTYSNGKTRTDKGIITNSKPANGWIQSTAKGQPGVGYFGYDPKKNKYVAISVGGPSNYGAGYFTVGTDKSMAFVFPDALDNDVLTPSDYLKFSATANGYSGSNAGPSDTYPGLRYTGTFTCVRQ